MAQYSIPFKPPRPGGTEFRAMQEAVEKGRSRRRGVHPPLPDAARSGARGAKVLLTTSCTHALEMTALLLDIQPGDEIILPSFTFVSSVNAYVLRGARPVFVDIRPDTLNLDERQLRTWSPHAPGRSCRFHYAGVACEMETI